MHHRRDLVIGEGARQRCAVEKVAGHQWAGNEAAMTRREVVIDDGLIAGTRSAPAQGVRANIASASRDEDSRWIGHGCYPEAKSPIAQSIIDSIKSAQSASSELQPSRILCGAAPSATLRSDKRTRDRNCGDLIANSFEAI